MSCGTQVPPPCGSTVSVTGLSPSPAALPFAFSYRLATSSLAVLQPRVVHRYTRGLGSSAFARHYWGNHVCFLFLEVLRCFSSLGWRHRNLPTAAVLQTAGLSHSEIPGSEVICTYPGLIAAYHVLHRLHEPRHPPCALYYFRFPAKRPDAHTFSSSSHRPSDMQEGVSCYYSLACVNMSKISFPT